MNYTPTTPDNSHTKYQCSKILHLEQLEMYPMRWGSGCDLLGNLCMSWGAWMWRRSDDVCMER